MKTYPLCLVGLESRRAVVIGGGSVAARKAQALLEAGAVIQAISPDFCDEFDDLILANPTLQLLQRPYKIGDLADAWIVIAATDDPQVNHSVWEEACARKCLVNVVDDPEHSNFILPAVVRRGEVTVAVSTGGGSPALARRMREQLEELIGPEYGDLAALLAALRPELIARHGPGEPRLRAALRLVDAGLLNVIRTEGLETARRRARQLLDESVEGEP